MEHNIDVVIIGAGTAGLYALSQVIQNRKSYLIVQNGELLLVDDKQSIMHKLGKKQLNIELKHPVAAVPDVLSGWELELSADGSLLTYTYDPHNPRTGIAGLIGRAHV